MKKVPIIKEKEPYSWNPWNAVQTQPSSKYERALDDIASVTYNNISSDEALYKITSILHSVGK